MAQPATDRWQLLRARVKSVTGPPEPSGTLIVAGFHLSQRRQ
jgi:hypothetical protein